MLAQYQALVDAREIAIDAAQHEAVVALDLLSAELSADIKRFTLRRKPIKGLYLWGDVGRGKTFLMDLFYDSLPPDKKVRMHFHHFMAWVHRSLEEVAGQPEPLSVIAKRFAKGHRVICFDEFFVSDIADAMLLGRLFEALFACGVTLVATSNIPIERLYWDGLQRSRFLPAIALLEAHLQMLHLSGVHDHRLRHLTPQKTYYLPHEQDFDVLFSHVADEVARPSSIRILGRDIDVYGVSKKAAWADFSALCEGPRSALDYIEIAKRWSVVLVSGIPILGGELRSGIKARGTEDGSFSVTETGERVVQHARMDDPARRFISLVDEFYDQNVALYLQADVPLAELYCGGALTFEFRRTRSRLTEMQSHEYLQRVTGETV